MRAFRPRPLPASHNKISIARRCLSTIDEVVREGDTVILRRVKKPPYITKPLTKGGLIGTHFGDFKHDDIIGKNYRDTVATTKHKYARIHRPTLGEYTTLTPRLVTPVYPADCNLIVSLLDIHVDPPSSSSAEETPPLEILEAGTGHGALTLHLARAVNAANPIPPSTSDKEAYKEWRKKRQAIIHTLDVVPDHSKHAKKVVEGFRNGMYAGAVDFHVRDLGQFIDTECQRRGVNGRIFHHILLDLPGVHEYIVKAAQALRADGTLIVFCPSITQIAQCVEVIRKLKLRLSYDQVVELGAGYGAGKQWDVRLVAAKKKTTPALNTRRGQESVAAAKDARQSTTESSPSGIVGFLTRLFGGAKASGPAVPVKSEEEEVYYTVCRPSVGHKVVGGGFVGVWRAKRDWEKSDDEDD